MNRESWLQSLTDALRPTFTDAGHPLPETLRVTCGFPSRSSLARKSRRIGEAWGGAATTDGIGQILVSPLLDDAPNVGAILVHELVHLAVGVEAGHKGPFRKCALAVGLEGKMTSTNAGAQLVERLHALAEPLGPYPHSALKAGSGKPPQSTRMLKVECADCGCVVRMTRKWLDDAGLPTCGCGGEMAETSIEGE